MYRQMPAGSAATEDMPREPAASDDTRNRAWPGGEQMNLQKIYAALLTADLAPADEKWLPELDLNQRQLD